MALPISLGVRRRSPYGRVRLDGVEHEGDQVVRTARGAIQRLDRRRVRRAVAPRAHRSQRIYLVRFAPGIYTQRTGSAGVGLGLLERVHADDDSIPALDLDLVLVRGALNLPLRISAFDRGDHSAHFVDPRDVVARHPLERVVSDSTA